MKCSKYLVLGAGPTGTHTARLLADAGDDVTLASRRGGSSEHPRITRAAIDARDAKAVSELAAGASVIFNCAMPAYDRWPEEFPPLAAAALSAALGTGARLVTLSNVYGYGAVPGAFSEALPLQPSTIKGRVRAKMWQEALASRASVCEVRASDFLGAGAASLYTLAVLPSVLRGEPVSVLGDPQAAHSFSYTRDVATTLVAAARSEAAWGRAWHVPSHTLSMQALSERLAELAGAPPPTLTRMTLAEFQGLTAADSILREVVEMAYLFERPCLLDSAESERALGVHASALDVVLRDTLAR
jgi:nucleoside-diphosphate-sugar epimerase